MLRVSSNSIWRAFVPSSAQSWLHIEPATGAGDGEIHVWCEPHNNADRDRLTLIVIVAGTQNPKQRDVLVQQASGSGHEEDHHREPWEDDNQDPTLSRKQ